MIWIRVKWHHLMVLLGLHLPTDFYLARAVIKRHGRAECKYLFDLAVLLMARHGRTPRARKAVEAATEPPAPHQGASS
jgi:hypothetical protein